MGKFLRIVAWVSLVVGVIVGILKATVLEWWVVPNDDPAMTSSLAPSLFAGDVILLWKGTMKFGDLARCADPQTPGRFVIGRILGEPQDHIEIRGADVAVNNKHAIQEHSCSPNRITVADPSSGADVELHCAYESTAGHKHMRASSPSGSSGAYQRTATVADDQFYLVSDNRVYPFDSRDYGGVPRSTCKELVFFRIRGAKGWGDETTRLTYIR